MIHPDTELRFINDKIGHGVVATKRISKGTITWALDTLDRIFTQEQIRGMDPLYHDTFDKYTYRNPEGNYILCWDNARFVNHSSNSNCITTAYEFEIAIRDIEPGEELTDDYGYLNLEEPFNVIPETGSTRTVIYPDDLLRYYPVWDEKLLGAFPEFSKVNQPLLAFLDKSTREKATAISLGEIRMDSIIHCYFHNGTKAKNGNPFDLRVRSPKVIYPF